MARRSSTARRAQREQAASVARRSTAELAQRGLRPEGAVLLAQFITEAVGKIVLPGEPGYDTDRQESNPAFQAWPLAICYCAVESDVALCLKLAENLKVPFVVRSGGHSTAGFSVVNNGIIIDMSGFDQVLPPDTHALTVRVGPGATFDKLNGALNATGLHVPSGECGDVRVGGFVQGGGYGYTSRMFGIQSDCVLEFRVMLADGSIVTANATENALLHWAMRGGTGGNFGVMLEVTYQLFPVPSVWAWAIQWNAADSPAVLVELQANYMRHGAAPALGMTVNLGFNEGQQVMLAQGMWVGSRADGLAAVASLLKFPSAQLLSDMSGPYGAMDKYLDTMPYAIPNPPDGSREDKMAGYVATTLSLAEWQAIVAYAATTPNPANTLIIEPYGGVIATVPKLASAFVHRDVDMDVFVDVFWVNDGDAAAAKAWLAGFMALLKPHLNGHVYQNYPHRDLPNFAWAYWGEALPKLQQAKLTYDKGNVFHFPQSVPLP